MKNISMMKKIGLITLISLPILLSANLTTRKGLESKLGVSTASASEVTVAEDGSLYNEEGWPVPSLDGYEKIAEKWKDSNDDGIKETILKQYMKKGEGFILVYSTKKGIWAIGKIKDKYDKNYFTLLDPDNDRDSNDNKTFEKKYLPKQRFSAPSWAL